MIMAVTVRSMLAAALAVAFACGTLGCGKSEAPAPAAPTAAKPATEAPVEDTRPAIAAFGDSISAGFGVEPGKSYPDDLQKLLDAGGYRYRVVNLGVSGDTTTDAVERLPSVLAIHPAIAIVEFGGNDGLRGQPIGETEKNLARILEALQKAGAKVVLAGMTLPRNYGPEYIRSFDRMYVDLGRKYRVITIPFLLEGVGGNPALMQPDGLHPTAEGAQIVAHTAMRHLEPLLRR